MTGKPETMAARDELHRLVDELPEEERHAARRYLEYLRNTGSDRPRPETEEPAGVKPATGEESEGEEA